MRRWAAPAALLLLAAGLSGRALSRSAARPFPVFDEISYIERAREVARLGGPTALLRAHIDASWLEDNRNPLHLALLSALMKDSRSDFEGAKLLSLGSALILLGCLGVTGGVGAVGIVALSPHTARLGQTVGPDILFAALFCAAVWTAASAGVRRWRWAGFGVFVGLAWLSKGNGHILLASLLVLGLRPWKSEKRAVILSSLSALGGFLAVSWPLLLRNSLVWKDPFHHLSSRSLWLMAGEEFVRYRHLPLWDQIGPVWFLEHHSTSEILIALASGIIEALGMFIRAAAFGPSGAMEWVTGLMVWVLIARGILLSFKEAQDQRLIAVLAPCLVLAAGCAWSAKGGESFIRYGFPVVCALLPFAFIRLPKTPTLLWPALGLFLLLGSWKGLTVDPRRQAPLPPFWEKTSSFLASRGGAYIIDHRSLFSDFDRPPRRLHAYPLDVSEQELRGFTADRGIDGAVVDGLVVSTGPVLGWPLCFHEPPLAVYAEGCEELDSRP